MFSYRIRKFLFVLFSIFFGHISAQAENFSLISLSPNWKIDFNSRIGATTRIRATEQHPFPFCFATAATMLWDQQRCMADKKDCRSYAPSSFLATVSAGQRLDTGAEIELTAGGSPIRSLLHLVKNGSVPYSQCNYSHIDPNNSGLPHSFSNLNFVRESWLKYKDYTPYLERYYRKDYYKSLKSINPNISELQAEIMLKLQLSRTELAAGVFMNPDCWLGASKDNRFLVKFLKIEDRSNSRQAFITINKLLEEKKPVIINFCIRFNNIEKCENHNNHSAVIVAKALAKNEVTGDRRTVYWIVNSWGEKWQEENRDGWVFADHLIYGINGELIWLETK